MRGAIFFSGKYGSTAQYARWIAKATALPIFDINEHSPDPLKYDFLVLGSSIIFYKPTMRNWIKSNQSTISSKPVIFFTVSGAPGGPKLDRWLAKSLPKNLLSHMKHVALRGRMNPSELSWGLRLFMRIGSLLNPDPQASREERLGFDYMDKSGIAPILQWVAQFQETEALP